MSKCCFKTVHCLRNAIIYDRHGVVSTKHFGASVLACVCALARVCVCVCVDVDVPRQQRSEFNLHNFLFMNCR
jgi:hypothetical protein